MHKKVRQTAAGVLVQYIKIFKLVNVFISQQQKMWCLIQRCWFQDSSERSERSTEWSNSRWPCHAPRSQGWSVVYG